jgi:transposase
MFLRELLRHTRGPIIVLLDNSSTHKGAPLEQVLGQHRRLRIEYFPSYAPQLNPDEGVWSLAKRELANSCPNDIDELMEDILGSIEGIRNSSEKLRGCIAQSELPLFFALEHCIIYAVVNRIELSGQTQRKGTPRYGAYPLRPVEAISWCDARLFVPEAGGGVGAVDRQTAATDRCA